jgi:hypothetical protein
MPALPPKADICSALAYVRFGPIADIPPFTGSLRRHGRAALATGGENGVILALILPPGLARLCTKPCATGSAIPTNTIGISRVASCSETKEGVPAATSTSGCSSTSSLASARAFSTSSPTAKRYSISILRPSTQPLSRSPARNAARRAWLQALFRRSSSAIQFAAIGLFAVREPPPAAMLPHHRLL